MKHFTDEELDAITHRCVNTQDPNHCAMHDLAVALKGERAGISSQVIHAALGPCPRCHNRSLLGFKFSTDSGVHMHTKYVCTYWRSGASAPCGWDGWTVPGWDDDAKYLLTLQRIEAAAKAICDERVHAELITSSPCKFCTHLATQAIAAAADHG